ncbi:MAG TPA: Hsp70 family protein, partial [Verrucomicrobiae bacterium]|nr:Hsp70 family protein [Verrucomicrobiae bacterium]
RWQGARVPGRLVSSAKSWLCHPGVDRSAAILPWGAPPEVQKLSPVEASAVLLGHLTQAWNSAHPAAPLQDQEVVITVPASFDEVARALTVTAARQAGLEKFTLLEEPQAAFYDFISRHRSCLATALDEVRLVLVVDVGGGTSDFTLVQVGVSPEGPIMRRIAVGEHLMLGGDNMDAALARKAEERLVSAGRRLTAVQWSQLVQAARVAKEALLNEEEQGSNRPPGPPRSEAGQGGAAHFTISIASEGSRLVGGAISTQVTRSEAEAIVLDGFLPACHPMDVPQRGARVALQELGLPYAQDPAITRHLAHFLRAHAVAGFTGLGEQRPGDALPRPDALLLNGGVFNSAKMTQRLVEVLSSWWPEKPPLRLLHHESLDLAVARGAAYYGLARRGLGRRIGGGTAHAIYVGLEAGDQATRSLCLVPRGQEEGEIIELPNRVFQLAVGEPVRFPLFSTTADRLERPGDLAPVSDEFTELPPIHTLLQTAAKTKGRVPVHLQARLTEIGTLELWCVSESGRERWRLEFELRGAANEKNVTVTESMPAGFAEARLWVERIFGKSHLGAPAGQTRAQPPKDVK